MTATYTFDVFTSLDGYGTHHGDWGGYWGKEGPELLARRLDQYGGQQRIVFGATTFREFVTYGADIDAFEEEQWVNRMRRAPMTVVSSTLDEPLDWPDARVVGGDAVDVVRRMKQESDVPIRSHGSLSLNWALLAAGLVDVVQVTLFPVITGVTGDGPILRGAGDFDLELLEQHTLDGRTIELLYRPTAH